MPPPNRPPPPFEAMSRESDRADANDVRNGPYGMPVAFRNVEMGRDEFGPILEFQAVDPERVQSGDLSDAPDDGGPDAAPGNRRGWSPL